MQRIGRRRGAGSPLVGVISDTHGLLRPEAVAALAGVDTIVHAGDIGSAEILDALRRIAPVIAVRGNNDRDAWAAALPEIARLEIGETRIWVVHDLKELAEDPASAGVGVVISGHSHRPRFSLPVAVARLHLAPAGPRAEIVELAVAGPGRGSRPTRRRGLDGARGTGAVSARGGAR